MNKTLRFSHKILLAVSLIVMLAFTLFTLYNDYLQRSATRTSLENYLAEMGESTSTNIRNLLEGRINLGETWRRTSPGARQGRDADG
jgi:methyl-accepting chemotaxis protein